MLKYWLQTHLEASWYQLIKALRAPGVELNSVAADLEKQFTGDLEEQFTGMIVTYTSTSIYVVALLWHN